jgi:hypothetical protein
MSRVNAIAPGGVETEGIHRIRVIGSDFEKQIVAEPRLGDLVSRRISRGLRCSSPLRTPHG